MECCSFLDFSSFLLRLPSGIDFKVSLAWFRVCFWTHFQFFFGSRGPLKMQQKILKAFIDFHSILDPIWVPTWVPQVVCEWSAKWWNRLLGHPGTSWRQCFGFLAHLSSFWDVFYLLRAWFLMGFGGTFSANAGNHFAYLCVCRVCFRRAPGTVAGRPQAIGYTDGYR